ncbi:MAG: PEP-CTERM system histidine kinase PrsK [Pseudomonadota bacterium]|nr:PEP-CTERM system histidine kinase PrsK [Pseudomonadota bacterium]
MTGLLSLWAHALAAMLYGALSLWQLRGWNGDRFNRPLTAAMAAMAVWALFEALAGPDATSSALAESARNLAFLGFIYVIVERFADPRQRGVKAVYAAVAAVIGLQILLALLLPRLAGDASLYAAATHIGHFLAIIISAGALVLVHNLYGQAAPTSRAGIQLPVIALSAMWAYDLHLYTVAYLTGDMFAELVAMRGAVAAMLVPLFALAAGRSDGWRVQLSRAATFQSLSLLAILGYFIVMLAVSRAMASVDNDWMRIAQLGFIFGVTALGIALLPSRKLRAWLRVFVTKHFFEHRYDYRSDWLRFTRAVGRAGEGSAPLGERIVKALAEMAGAEGGLLLLAEDGSRMAAADRWNWHGQDAGGDIGGALATLLEGQGYVLDFAALDEGSVRRGDQRVPVPGWLGQSGAAWAAVPLIHADRLVGLVLLAHPPLRRAMDWEDYDLFRTAGIQAASYLAEARSQQALADARRFDEFNRRFAFIMHDIKNLVSQLSLVTRNAERHADNPEFRADMIATLQSSVKKMNELLARLSRGKGGETLPPRVVPVQPIIAAIAEVRRHQHLIEIVGDARLLAHADPAGLEQALGHFIQNAIDASPAGAPVRIECASDNEEVRIIVADAGAGMSAEFVRTRLFIPFASTKDSGFGVGAFEARSLIAAMGGRVTVESREGEGSRFTIILPAGDGAATRLDHRMRA